MTDTMNPLTTPTVWRSVLYERVLLPWETGSVQIRPDAFNKKSIETALGLYVLRKTKLSELKAASMQWRNCPGQVLLFYSDGKGYESLFKALRNVVAHAHYTLERSGWIYLRHEYQKRGSSEGALRLFARMKFSTLKGLIQYLNQAQCS